ncbi:MAG: glycine zipper 2TM domain-containing protein [Alphaproteobacteria bacterium]|nr:glycine zipper 2TM domain-containing protein [Alphaproteobacteria bacterium]
MKKTLLTLTLIAGVALSGCETLNDRGTKELIGGGSGAIIGGVLGSQVGEGSGRLWAAGVGTLLGVLVGSEIGRSLDKADMAYAQKANAQAHTAPIGQAISWNNPESGNSGVVTPTRDGNDTAGRYCREYNQTINVGGQKETGYGIACRQPDGSWEIVG